MMQVIKVSVNSTRISNRSTVNTYSTVCTELELFIVYNNLHSRIFYIYRVFTIFHYIQENTPMSLLVRIYLRRMVCVYLFQTVMVFAIVESHG